jgi:hypothetical protein
MCDAIAPTTYGICDTHTKLRVKYSRIQESYDMIWRRSMLPHDNVNLKIEFINLEQRGQMQVANLVLLIINHS